MKNKATYGDNLDLLKVLDENSIDMIYCDPPFASGRNYGMFDDRWKELSVYLDWMEERFLLMRKVLKPTGAIFVHCNWRASHYLKCDMDRIFGHDWFRNEIIWCYAPAGNPSARSFHKKHDVILYYGSIEGTWHPPYTEMLGDTEAAYNKVDESGRRYNMYRGKRVYRDQIEGRPIPDWWTDIPSFSSRSASKEYIGYPTQKPLALMERLIEVCTEPGDLVLDPFCGSGSTLVAAKQLGREFIGFDLSGEAVRISNERIAG